MWNYAALSGNHSFAQQNNITTVLLHFTPIHLTPYHLTPIYSPLYHLTLLSFSPTGRWGMAMAREAWPNDFIANLIIIIL